KLVTVHHPIVEEHGDLELALYGSFLPVPDRARFDRAALDTNPRGRLGDLTTGDGAGAPGEVMLGPGDIVINQGRVTRELVVTHRGDRPIQVGSHYPFDQTNRALSFDRDAAARMHLDIPAGTAVRFEPGDTKTVRLVA